MTKMLTAAPYSLQNKWEKLFDVPIPWHMVYELVQKRANTRINYLCRLFLVTGSRIVKKSQCALKINLKIAVLGDLESHSQ
jgi:hypothetical protein